MLDPLLLRPIVTNQLPPTNCHQPIVTNQLHPCHPPIATNQLPPTEPTNCHQLIVTNQLSPTNCDQPIVTHQLPPTQLPPTNCDQPIVTNQLQPTNCHPPIATNQLPPTNCHQPWHLRGRRSTWCTPGGRMYAPAQLGLRRCAAVICVAGAALGALQRVGCTPWRGWATPLCRCDLRGRRSARCTPGGRR